MPAWLKGAAAGLGACGLLLAVAIGSAFALLQIRPAWFAAGLETGLGWFLGRSVEIGELAEVDLGAQTFVSARGLRVGNPAWAIEAGEPDLFSAGEIRLRVHVPSLWREGPVVIDELVVEDLAVTLLAPAGRPANWELGTGAESAPRDEDVEFRLPVLIGSARLNRGTLRYRDPDQDVRVLLDRLQIRDSATDGLLELRLSGVINDIPLAAEGRAGPTTALLTGRNLEMRFEAAWGRLQVTAEGRVGDLATLSRPDFKLDVSMVEARPLLDALGVPEVRGGPLRARVRVSEAGRGLNAEAKVDLGQFGVYLVGSVGNPRILDDMDLQVQLSGPSLAEAGAFFEVAGLPALPYEVVGTVRRAGARLEIHGGRLQLGQGQLAFAGKLWATDDGNEMLSLQVTDGSTRLAVQGGVGDGPGYSGTRIEVRAEGEDLGATARWLGAVELPGQPFQLSGSVALAGDGWQVSDARLSSGLLTLDLSASIDALSEGADLEGEFSASTTDLAATLNDHGLNAASLGSFPLAVQGRFDGSPRHLRLVDGRVESAVVEGSLRGPLGDLSRLVGLELTLDLAGPDLLKLLPPPGAGEARPVLPFAVTGVLAAEAEGWRARDVTGRIGEAGFMLDGRLGPAPEFLGSGMTLGASGSDLGAALAPWTARRLPAEAFDARLDLSYESKRLRVSDMRVAVGELAVAGQLDVSDPPDFSAIEGAATLAAPGVDALLRLLGADEGRFDLPDGPVNGSVRIAGERDRIRLDALDLKLGPSDLAGQVHVRLADVPEIDVDLRSRLLDLPFLVPDLQALEAKRGSSDREGSSAQAAPPLDGRLLPNAPLHLGWLRRLNGSFRYQADEVRAREGVSSRVRIDLAIRDGALTTRELSWEGGFSTGSAQLALRALDDGGAFEVYLDSRHLPLIWMLAGEPDVRVDRSYRLGLRGQGADLRGLLATLNGALVFEGGGGRVSNSGLSLILGDVLDEIFTRLNPFAKREPYTRIVCSAAALTVADGVVQVVPGLVVRTDKLDVASGGSIDLRDERVNLTFNTRSRRGLGISAAKAVTPYLGIGGTLAEPRLVLDTKGAAVSGGAAVATAGLSIIAGGLWDRWVATASNPCERLFTHASKSERAEFKALLARPAPAGAVERPSP